MSIKKINVLVFPGGTEIGLEICQALRYCKDINLYAGGLNISNHAPYVFEHYFDIPSIYDPEWIDELNKIIITYKIDYIFPAYDDIIVALAQNKNLIKARVVSSPLETCVITRSKSQTYNLFDRKVPVPKLYKDIDEIDTYPVFVKPDRGQGAQNTHLVKNRNDLSKLLSQNPDFIVTEYLPGEEFTVDCFSDREKGLLFCRGRKRVRTKSGIAMNSRLVEDSINTIFNQYAETIGESLSLHGAWFFQLKQKNSGEYVLLEIAPRVAGTMTLNRNLGVNFPLLSIYESERINVTINTNDDIDLEVDRALVNRYRHNLIFTKVYVDLDDTLIINGKVNIELVKFLYQCLNQEIKIILITKHTQDLDATLKKSRLYGIFDEIVHLEKTSNKSDSILAEGSIFIDDSFSERLQVTQKLGIPTFDSSMLEMLINDRI